MRREPKITIETVRIAVEMLGERNPAIGRAVLDAVRDVAKLERLQRRSRRLAEVQCNGISGGTRPLANISALGPKPTRRRMIRRSPMSAPRPRRSPSPTASRSVASATRGARHCGSSRKAANTDFKATTLASRPAVALAVQRAPTLGNREKCEP